MEVLVRAVDKYGHLIDFMLSDRRNTGAAYRFLRKALKTMSDYPPPSITTDNLASYPRAIRGFQRMKTAYAILKGFEVMRMIRRGHCVLRKSGATGQIRFVNQLFGLAA
jgi:transposase-like protein